MVADACRYGIGAVLTQDQRPLVYYSYRMNSADRSYPTGQQELLAVVKSLEQWRYYLEGCFGGLTVVTDHKPNTFLSSKPPALLSRGQVRWRVFLAKFHFGWEYRKGAYNLPGFLPCTPPVVM